jgi:hypothetical protein
VTLSNYVSDTIYHKPREKDCLKALAKFLVNFYLFYAVDEGQQLTGRCTEASELMILKLNSHDTYVGLGNHQKNVFSKPKIYFSSDALQEKCSS